MTEKEYDVAIKATEKDLKRLQEERRSLYNAGYYARACCPRPAGDAGVRKEHDWTVVSVDKVPVFAGESVQVANYECQCGATMTVTAKPDRE